MKYLDQSRIHFYFETIEIALEKIEECFIVICARNIKLSGRWRCHWKPFQFHKQRLLRILNQHDLLFFLHFFFASLSQFHKFLDFDLQHHSVKKKMNARRHTSTVRTEFFSTGMNKKKLTRYMHTHIHTDKENGIKANVWMNMSGHTMSRWNVMLKKCRFANGFNVFLSNFIAAILLSRNFSFVLFFHLFFRSRFFLIACFASLSKSLWSNEETGNHFFFLSRCCSWTNDNYLRTIWECENHDSSICRTRKDRRRRAEKKLFNQWMK